MDAILQQIEELKKKRNAVILAHVYQPGPIQEAADVVGDSLDLCMQAAKTDADTIVFCGVKFMAESAKLLNPGKTVLLPAADAGCPMADMAEPERLRAMKAENPEAAVVCYVNSTAAVKAESDICCTSSNAEKVINSLPADQPVIFVPDKHLGQYVLEKTGRQGILWPGFCPTHQRILPEHIEALKKQHPDALVAVHPEAPKSVRSLADFIGSTGQIFTFCTESSNAKFIIGTESGIIYRLKKFNPDKTFISASEHAVCPNMKKTTLDNIAMALKTMKPDIIIEQSLAEKAVRPIQKMLEL